MSHITPLTKLFLFPHHSSGGKSPYSRRLVAVWKWEEALSLCAAERCKGFRPQSDWKQQHFNHADSLPTLARVSLDSQRPTIWFFLAWAICWSREIICKAQTEIARQGGWLSGEEGDIWNKRRADLFSALAVAVGTGDQQEVLGRIGETTAKCHWDEVCMCV